MKNRKWYNNFTVKPDCDGQYIIMTDMGYIFEAYWKLEGWHVMEVHNNKCYFPLYEHQDNITKWMRISKK